MWMTDRPCLGSCWMYRCHREASPLLASCRRCAARRSEGESAVPSGLSSTTRKSGSFAALRWLMRMSPGQQSLLPLSLSLSISFSRPRQLVHSHSLNAFINAFNAFNAFNPFSTHSTHFQRIHPSESWIKDDDEARCLYVSRVKVAMRGA